MKVRNATLSDYEEILSIYEGARQFMASNGNPTQWKTTEPKPSAVKEDIENCNLYVITNGDIIEGVFAFIPGEDPTYKTIYNGNWLNELSYSAVHKVASAGRQKGIVSIAMDYAFSRDNNIKIDTHKNNTVMQKALEKYGFTKCGIIHLLNGEERIAYQKYNK